MIFGQKTLKEVKEFVEQLIEKYGDDKFFEIENHEYSSTIEITEVRLETDEEFEIRSNYYREQEKRTLEDYRKRVAELERKLNG